MTGCELKPVGGIRTISVSGRHGGILLWYCDQLSACRAVIPSICNEVAFWVRLNRFSARRSGHYIEARLVGWQTLIAQGGRARKLVLLLIDPDIPRISISNATHVPIFPLTQCGPGAVRLANSVEGDIDVLVWKVYHLPRQRLHCGEMRKLIERMIGK